tara:strand:- start:108 stop:668 length:561 start_codon:yes stop_codon:yes gene_type:complete
MIILYINIILLCLLVITAIAINQQDNLFATTMLTGIFSLLSASLFLCLDAVDVAFTEAAVGAGIALILFLGTLSLIKYKKQVKNKISIPGLLIVILTGGFLIYGLQDIPAFGKPENPVQVYLGDKYIVESKKEIGIPNLVTSVLASYRGFDTLGEVTVIFTAGIGVLMLLGRGRDNYKGIVSRERT